LIILDSDVMIEILDKESELGQRSAEEILESNDSVATTAVNLHEVLYGLNKHGKRAEGLRSLRVLGFNRDEAILSSRIESELEREGMPVQRADAMIAAVTILNRAKLHTYNSKHFTPMKRFGLVLFK